VFLNKNILSTYISVKRKPIGRFGTLSDNTNCVWKRICKLKIAMWQ